VANPDPMTVTLEVVNPALTMVLAPKEVPREVTVAIPRDTRAAVPVKEAEKVLANLGRMTALVLAKDLVNPVLTLEAVENPVLMMDTLEVATEEEENLVIMTTMVVTEEVILLASSTVILSTVPEKAAALARDHMTDTLEVAENPAPTLEEVVASLVLMMALAPKEVPREVMEVTPRDIRAAVPEREAVKAPVNPVLTLEEVANPDHMMAILEVVSRVPMMDTLVEEENLAIMTTMVETTEESL